MKRSIPLWQVGGFIFTSALGTFLHFLFDITGGSPAAGLFSAVNESIWEHLKLLFYPMLLFSAVEYFVWGKEISNFWCVKLKGTLIGLILIPTLFYTYSGILGVTADWFNVTIFFIAGAVVYYLETRQFLQGKPCRLDTRASLAVFALIAAFFTVFTFFTPQIPLFRDPLTGTYGFQSGV